MTNRYWFKPKTVGYGVTPVSWEGWLSGLAYCAVVLGCALAVGLNAENVLTMIACAATFTVATVVMVRVTRARIDVNGIGAQAPVGNDWKH